MIQRFFVALMLLLALGAPVRAQDESGAVIRRQLGAFNAADIDLAWSYASRSIQAVFGTTGNFALMVQSGYPMVWQSQGARIEPRRDEAGVLWQKVLVTDAAGDLHALDYQMVETEDGWKINAVVLLPAPDIGS